MKGVEKWRTPLGFYVCQVHYSADPDKDPSTEKGLAWYNKVRLGMPEEKWRKEYEIDWFALSGSLIYPMFNRNLHVIDPFRIPEEWTKYMAIDPGLRNPTAALWAAVDKEDDIYFFEEYYQPERTVREHAECIKAIEKRLGFKSTPFRLIDPAASARNIINKKSVVDEFKSFNLYCKAANNDVDYGVGMVQQNLSPDPETGCPRVYFFSSLKNTISEIMNYRYEEISAKVAERKDPSEKPVKKRDHLMDCLRYILAEKPRYYKPVMARPYTPQFVSGKYNAGY